MKAAGLHQIEKAKEDGRWGAAYDAPSESKVPKDFLKANCIKFSGGAGPWWTFQDGSNQFTVPVSGNLELNHVPPVIEACAAGLGFGMFVSYQVTPYIARKKLVVVLQKFELPPRPINLVYPNARPLPARTKVLIDWLKRELTDFEQQPK